MHLTITTNSVKIQQLRSHLANLCGHQFLAADWLGVHADEFEYRSLPLSVQYGELKMCYRNAAMLAMQCPYEYAYVEGYAMGFIPVQHAWCIDRAGKVVDPTWNEDLVCGTDRAYFGVPLKTHYVIDHLSRTHYYSTLFANSSELLQGTVEYATAVLDLQEWIIR